MQLYEEVAKEFDCLIETWDVLKCISKLTVVEESDSLIETWDVLKSMNETRIENNKAV